MSLHDLFALASVAIYITGMVMAYLRDESAYFYAGGCGMVGMLIATGVAGHAGM